jgi:transcriptional regulator with XRE-family HTH domain
MLNMLSMLSIVSNAQFDVQYPEQWRQVSGMHTTDPHALGQRVAHLRRGHGLSQRRLAEQAGVSHGYIALLELGRLASPGTFRLDAIARALGFRTSDSMLDPPPEPSARWLDAALPQLGGEASGAGNVSGTLDQIRPRGAQPLPVFRWGSCGDPRDRESPPDPDRLEYPPPGRETLIGASGFGVVVKGESMSGRGIHDGDVVWVNPERPYALGKVVLALASDVAGAAGMVVKTYARTEVGECLVSETAEGRSPVICSEFKVIGPVVGITSWRLPN